MRARALLVTVIGVGCLAAPAPTRAAATATSPVSSWGYVRMDDGAQLRYMLLRPSGRRRFPVALNYGPYLSGSDLTAETLQTQRLVSAGYAVLGVNIRGTGCSSGYFDAFERREAVDAVEVIEWAAAQSW